VQVGPFIGVFHGIVDDESDGPIEATLGCGDHVGPTDVIVVHFYGEKVVLLLGGYDKGKDPKEKRQQREIARARKLLAQFKERQRRTR